MGSLTDATTLSSLGIAAGDKIMVGDGTNTTTYTSTGTDTVGDLINAINSGTAGNATVTASLSGGNLVLTGNNFTATISVTGSGANDASDLGFGASHNTFPTDQSADAGIERQNPDRLGRRRRAADHYVRHRGRRRRDARRIADRQCKS